jgi:transposase
LVSRELVFEQVRRDRRIDPLVSVRELARRHHLARRTVRTALESAVPKVRRKPVRSRSVLAPATGWIDAMLREDLTAPRKQRHTIDRIWSRLAGEYDFHVSYSTVRDYVAVRRPQILAEARAGAGHVQGTVPQVHLPGEQAEVDFAEVWVDLAGKRVKCALFTLRMSYSGRAVHRVYGTQAQEAFLEGHLEAFGVLGGVPTVHIRYDNLKPAVKSVCFGSRSRVESARWVTFRSWAGFDAFYCIPGQEGAHEKGGVEHEGGRFRRKYLAPVVAVDSLAELNARLTEIDAAEDGARHVHGRTATIAEDFAAEAPVLRRLPCEDFDCGVTLTPMVRRDSRIVVRQNYYSVPARFIGGQVRVSLRANELWVFEGRHIVAVHPRLTGRYLYRDVLDHYLEILAVKPGALRGAAALAQARQAGVFTAVHDAFWEAAVAGHGQADGTRALIEVLLLHRQLPPEAVLAGIATVLRAGSVSPQQVAIEARNALADGVMPSAATPGGEAQFEPDITAQAKDDVPQPAVGAQVITLQPRSRLPDDSRPMPSVEAYDRLLFLSSKGASA